MEIGVGIVGAGNVAALHAEAVAAAGARVAGVYDVHPERARRLADAHPPASAAESLPALLSRDDVHGVVVATPNAFHRPTAIAALRASKDVLLEKPMALNVAECDEVMAAARESDRRVQIGFVCRYAPAAEAARALIAAGALGRVYHAKATLVRRRGIPGLGRWFTDRARAGGGVLMDLGVHLIDLVLFLTGAPRALRAAAACSGTFGRPIERYVYEDMWGGPPDPAGVCDVEDAASALVRFDGGLTMELSVAWAAHLPEGRLGDGFLLFGERGGCFIDLWGNELVLATERDGRVVDERQALPACNAWTTAWRRQAECFLDLVRRAGEPEASADAGRRVQAVVDAIYRSAAGGREVDV